MSKYSKQRDIPESEVVDMIAQLPFNVTAVLGDKLRRELAISVIRMLDNLTRETVNKLKK